jgi:hypothetical protein
VAHPKHRKQHTRQRILCAAARLFADRGFSATTIDDVMLECGLTRGGFYAHFRSKAQLHHEALPLAQQAADLPGLLGHEAALAATAMWTGALAVAQSVGDESLAAQIADACRKAACVLRDEVDACSRPAYFWSPAGAALH